MTIEATFPPLRGTGKDATSLGALTSQRNHRGASERSFAARAVAEAIDGSPSSHPHVPNVLETGDERRQSARGLRRILESRDGRSEKIPGQPHGALRFSPRPRACLDDMAAGVDGEPE